MVRRDPKQEGSWCLKEFGNRISDFVTAVKSVINLGKILALLNKSLAIDFSRVKVSLLGCDK